MFIDREDAAARLAAALTECAGMHPVIVALTPGASLIGHALARALGGELDALCAPHRRRCDMAGRPVIVVDEGMATGVAMRTALRAARSRAPSRLICAVPVASMAALAFVEDHADEIVCLHKPEVFDSVAHAYRHLPEVLESELAGLVGWHRPTLHLPPDAAPNPA